MWLLMALAWSVVAAQSVHESKKTVAYEMADEKDQSTDLTNVGAHNLFNIVLENPYGDQFVQTIALAAIEGLSNSGISIDLGVYGNSANTDYNNKAVGKLEVVIVKAFDGKKNLKVTVGGGHAPIYIRYITAY